MIAEGQSERLRCPRQVVDPDVALSWRTNRERESPAIRRQADIARIIERLFADTAHSHAGAIDPYGAAERTGIAAQDERSAAVGGDHGFDRPSALFVNTPCSRTTGEPSV